MEVVVVVVVVASLLVFLVPVLLPPPPHSVSSFITECGGRTDKAAAYARVKLVGVKQGHTTRN